MIRPGFLQIINETYLGQFIYNKLMKKRKRTGQNPRQGNETKNYYRATTLHLNSVARSSPEGEFIRSRVTFDRQLNKSGRT